MAELVRAANRVEKLGDSERVRLFEQAVSTIRGMCATIHAPAARADADRMIELQLLVAARGARATDPNSIRDALLTAAGMIRDLHIILDT